MGSMRCKLTGHDLDACGVCKRCGEAKGSQHQWKAAEREQPCFKREVCERCETERQQPEHDWQMENANLVCSRCGLKI